jgi:hypothetical protein
VSTHPADHDIQTFWAWFASIADALGADLTNPALLEALDARVRRLGDLGWELGPGSTAENALALSPDGDRDLLPLTQHVVAMAPTVPRWVFLPARPARPAPFEFTLGAGPDEFAIDATSWRYVLYRFPDHTFDLVLEQANLADATDDERYTAAVILLDALLGEEARLLRVREVEPMVSLPPELQVKASPLTSLAEHLAAL